MVGANYTGVVNLYRDQGVVRACVSLPAAKGDQVLPILDKWAGLIRQVNG